MAGERWLVDSNIIRWTQPSDPSFATIVAAVERLELLADIPCFVSQNLGEFWNVLTRPANRNGYGRLPEEADRLARGIEAKFRFLPDSPAVHEEWRRLLKDYRVSGVQVHDARLVAAMGVHGVRRILTLNAKDFARFEDIEAIHP